MKSKWIFSPVGILIATLVIYKWTPPTHRGEVPKPRAEVSPSIGLLQGQNGDIRRKGSLYKVNQNSIGVSEKGPDFIGNNRSSFASETFLKVTTMLSAVLLTEAQIQERTELLKSQELLMEAVQILTSSDSLEITKNQALDILIHQFELQPDFASEGIAKVLSQNSEQNKDLLGYQSELVFKILDRDPAYLDWIYKNWSSSNKDKVLSNIANLENRK